MIITPCNVSHAGIAEESGGGKVLLLERGAYEGMDLCLMYVIDTFVQSHIAIYFQDHIQLTIYYIRNSMNYSALHSMGIMGCVLI